MYTYIDVGKFYEIHLNYTVLRRGDVHLMMWSIVNVWPDAHWPTTSSEPLSCTWQAMHWSNPIQTTKVLNWGDHRREFVNGYPE